MTDPKNDKRIVLSLDAGGTNFVFSAIQGNEQATVPFTLPAVTDDINKCLETLIKGFDMIKGQLNKPIEAISFAFPGPADYHKGIIGDLPNFPAFTGGVPLGSVLEEVFHMPVFINNDGNLFAYGEALTGYLPELNAKLKAAGSEKVYENLIGLTLGTGFGCGIALSGHLHMGDTSCGAEIHSTLNRNNPNWNAEESVSTRAIQRVYAEEAGIDFNSKTMPKDIYNIAKGNKEGNKEAAIKAFEAYGENLGASITNIVSIIDGIVVLGGGITAAWDLFAPAMFKEINRSYENFRGENTGRTSLKIFNLEDESTFDEFVKGNSTVLKIPNSNKTITYDSLPRTGVGISKLGGSKATMLGAYAYALQQLDSKS